MTLLRTTTALSLALLSGCTPYEPLPRAPPQVPHESILRDLVFVSYEGYNGTSQGVIVPRDYTSIRSNSPQQFEHYLREQTISKAFEDMYRAGQPLPAQIIDEFLNSRP